MSLTVRKKRVTKPKASAKSLIESELELLMAETPDVNVPEPVPGSPFIRKGFVECISSKGNESILMVGKIYTINELHLDGERLQISCEDGDYHWIHGKFFKAIDYGPFKPNDLVLCNGFEGAVSIKGELDKDLLGGQAEVMEGDATHATIRYGSGHLFKVPNENLRLRSRRTQMKSKNPFKTGDTIRCIKDGRGCVCIGWLYTVKQADGDFVWLTEDHDGDRFFHNMFEKYDKLKKKVPKVKDFVLKDFVRKFYNKYSYEKLTPAKLIKYMRDEKVPKELIVEEEVIKVLKEVNKTVFHW